MYEFQMIQQNGVQELVEVSRDEDGLPCIFLHDIEQKFSNAVSVSSYGVRIHFAVDETRAPKQPLRIPYFENRVLDVESDNSSMTWSREATEARYASRALAVGSDRSSSSPRVSREANEARYAIEATSGYINTLHTEQLPGILDLDPEALIFTDDDASANENEMLESESSSSEDGEQEQEQEEVLPRRRLSIMSSAISSSPTPVTGSFLPSAPRRIRTVQSRSSIPLESVPEHTSFTRDNPPPFSQSPTSPSTSPSRNHRTIIEDTELGDTVPPPEYLLLDPISSRSLSSDHPSGVVTAIDDPLERHLVGDRNEIIKRNCKTILGHNYDATSCPHPPLFIMLPDNPLRWSYDNILQNKMRLYFLCSSCERTVHIVLDSGFELKMDQYQDQQLLVKFGHYMLSLLRMLRYGVSLGDIFVPAAFDRPVPPVLSSGSLGGIIGSDPQLFFRTKFNIERSIAYLELLLGDDYDEDLPNMLDPLNMDDFRILDYIIKRSLRSSSDPTTSTSSPTSTSTGALTTDIGQDITLKNIQGGGSRMYRILSADDRTQWCCSKYYGTHYQNLDTTFTNKLEKLQVSLNSVTRSVVFVATTPGELISKMSLCSNIRSLFHVDVTLDWAFEKAHLDSLANIIRQEATTITSISIRVGKRSPPLTWKKDLPIIAGDDQQLLSGLLNLVKNQRIKHLVLEGDINLMSVPNIGAMDFTNLDSLSVMRTITRGFNINNGANNMSSGSSVHSNENFDGASSSYSSSSNRGQTQDSYIPELVSFLHACSFLSEITLGFPDTIPGHIRILQACASTLNRLKRLDLFRVIGTKAVTGSSISRKLELSASIISGRVKRLYMTECKATGENKLRLLESLEELIIDDAPYIEDLELRYVGFNDKHAHALELGTRPTLDQYNTRLRRLVIQGNGLERAGVFALRKVMRRATLLSRFSRNTGNSPLGAPSTGSDRVSLDLSAGTYTISAATPSSESITYGNLLEHPTLTHVELSSIDSLLDSDWAELLSDLDLKHVITLRLQGVNFGDRAIAALTKSSTMGVSLSPQQSPTADSFSRNSFSSQQGNLSPPPFSSALSRLPLKTLELSCSSLSREGVMSLQEFLSRLAHLSAISLHGFRKVTPDLWVNIISRIAFQWIEKVDIVTLGFDDDCAKYLGERIQARDQVPENSLVQSEHLDSDSTLPVYESQISLETTTIDTTTTTTTAAASASSVSPTSRVARRESLSSRLFGTVPMNARSNNRGREQNENKPEEVTVTTPPVTQSVLAQKYLELDLRYTDVSTKGLKVLRSMISGHAQKVVVRMRDEEDGGDDDDVKELARLTAQLNGDSGNGTKSTKSQTSSTTTRNHIGGSGQSTSSQDNSANKKVGASQQQPLQPMRSATTFSKFKSVFKKS